MIKTDGPGVFLPASDCVLLDRALRDALRFGWLGRRAIPPFALIELADLVHGAALEYRPREYRTPSVTCGTGTVSAPAAQTSTTSEATEVLLTTTEAAAFLGVTDSYVRRLARESALRAEQGAGGGWRFPQNELEAWKRHREETNRRAA